MKIENIAIVLVEPLYEINIGYVARIMKNFCLVNLILVNPRCEIGDTAYRYAMHGREILDKAQCVESLDEVFENFDLVVSTSGKSPLSSGYHRRSLTPEDLVKMLSKIRGEIAILFGREDIGLTNEIIKKSDLLVYIPANIEYSTLNLSHAVAIIAYIIFRELKYRSRTVNIASKRERELLLDYFSLIFEKSQVPSHKTEKAKLVLRRILSRANTSKEEIYSLITVFRRVYSYIEKNLKT
ncbi:MAG: RNA methyltransferase [Thermoprotei archaeon]|nr:MAG: RNA methyltransferase [Thermoprotei archaeon]